MISSEVTRTLVKSPPELWALLSDPASLARHLGELGEVRIVRTEPESAVEWEGEGITGAVALKASGWGTKVTLTATRQPPAPPAPPEPLAEHEPEPVPEAKPLPEAEPETAPEPAPRPGFFARLFHRRRSEPEPMPEPVAASPEPEPKPEAPEEDEQPDIAAELLALEESAAAKTTAVLTAVLDRLGAAHHRPFSRA
jgi:outer membrane biosynthesis protein TonB